ncbi:family 1 glycosylhydrolase [Candidatus Neptunichlamydia sp. REUL1]|uniref:family 1 glycosylhydrolase n=1 Tax=Candidatus Neptunichlamydia sp. REUL1 TaxID=3064277 RepID=UPI00403DA9DE
MTTFRFSVEWSNIEPKKGEFNEKALNHYVHFCKRLAEEGVEPMITLHYFTHHLGVFRVCFRRLPSKSNKYCSFSNHSKKPTNGAL